MSQLTLEMSFNGQKQRESGGNFLRTWRGSWEGRGHKQGKKKIEIKLGTSGSVHFSFQLPPLKYYLPNRHDDEKECFCRLHDMLS